MGRDAHLVEVIEDVLGNAVVEHALAVNDFVLLLVEGGGVVLEELNQRSGLRPLVEDLGLAFIDAPTAVHGDIPWFEKIHWPGSRQQNSVATAAYGRLKMAGRTPRGGPYSIGRRSTISVTAYQAPWPGGRGRQR